MHACIYVCMYVFIYPGLFDLFIMSLMLPSFESKRHPGYPLALVHQISAGLGAFSPTEAREGIPIGELISQSGYSFSDTPYFSC